MTYLQCGTDERRLAVKESKTINGIDYLEVFVKSTDFNHSILLLVKCFKKIGDTFDEKNIVIDGGIRIKNIQARWARRADILLKNKAKQAKELATTEHEQKVIKDFAGKEKNKILVICPDQIGDSSTYTLRLVKSNNYDMPPENFDMLLSKIDFSFRAGCTDDFDYLSGGDYDDDKQNLMTKTFPGPVIDYMAKDYASFQRLLLDRLSVINPDWKERNPADMGIALVEMLAHVGDQLSYYQDAVATEAYLGTARKRVSIRRHARLLDYFVYEGCNARALVCIEVIDRKNKKPGSNNKNNDSKKIEIKKGTKLLTGSLDNNILVKLDDLDSVLVEEKPEVFETMHAVKLCESHNEIYFYTWGDSQCYLKKGATSATLYAGDNHKKNKLDLEVGHILIFEEVRSPITWRRADRDPSHRHTVRLTSVRTRVDNLNGTEVVEVTWNEGDALPFDLCLWEKSGQDPDYENNKSEKLRIGVARGNIVLADHGNTILRELSSLGSSSYSKEKAIRATEFLGDVPIQGKFRPHLSKKPLTFACPFDIPDEKESTAWSALNFNGRDSLPQVKIYGDGEWWHPVPDLLSSDKFAYEFVVEIDNDGTVHVRFGDVDTDGGNIPIKSSKDISNPFYAVYRVGNGKKGNVGAHTITRIVVDKDIMPFEDLIKKVHNPIQASGGEEPESIEQIRQYAPYAFLKQERAVTEDDYIELLESHPEVQKANATIKWTGSWHTIHVVVDRKGGLIVDDDFKTKIKEYLDRYRLAGHDIKIDQPKYVPLDIAMHIYMAPNYFREQIRQKLGIFSSGILEDGEKGFFHPDNFIFGQSVFLSQLYEAAMNIEGVSSVIIKRFQRLGELENNELEDGLIKISPFEIARLDNDPNFLENGKIRFEIEGGL